MQKTTYVLACVAGILVGSAACGAAQAITPVLTKLDSEQVWDPSTKLVWVSDWNLAKTSGYDDDGRMTWAESSAWISSLNASNYAGHNDWRLPTTNTSPSSNCSASSVEGAIYYNGYECTGSEMGHMFYEALGGHRFESVLTQTHDTDAEKQNLALFKNVKADFFWSSTEFVKDPNRAWGFGNNDGHQGLGSKSLTLYALAVRQGDLASAVPEPQIYALMFAGLGLVAGVARRRSRPT